MKNKFLKKAVVQILFLVFSVMMVANMEVVFANTSPNPDQAAAAETSESNPDTVLPLMSNPKLTVADCLSKLSNDNVKKDLEDNTTSEVNEILGCAIKTGQIKLYMVPYFVRYILEFIIGLSGLVALGAIIYGGFNYVFAGVSNDKESGKKAIMNGLIGMVITLTAWAVVNIVISLVTSV